MQHSGSLVNKYELTSIQTGHFTQLQKSKQAKISGKLCTAKIVVKGMLSTAREKQQQNWLKCKMTKHEYAI